MAASCLNVLVVLAAIVRAHGIYTTEINHYTEVVLDPSDQETNEGKYRFYRITVNPNGEAYQLARRYSEFLSLKDQIALQLPDIPLFEDAPFPEKFVFTAMTDRDYEERRDKLQTWLRRALETLRDNENVTQDLYNFLDPVSGDASRLSGIMMPSDSFRKCWKTHFWGIQVKPPGDGTAKGIKLYRRYNQFDTLKKALGKAAERLPGNVEFPYKGWMSPITEFQEDERRRGLERWLQEVVKSPNRKHQWKDHVDKFLDPEDAKAEYLQCIADAAGTNVHDILHFDGTTGVECKCPKCGRDEF